MRQRDLPAAATGASTAPTTSPGQTYSRIELPTGVKLSWDAPAKSEKIRQYAVYTKHGNIWKLHVLPGDTTETVIRDNPGYGYVSAVVIASIDRAGNESKRVTAKLPKRAKK
jgi:hypothetical protein